MTDSIEKANEYASDVLERLHKESLAPTPDNFSLWYAYYSESDPDIVRAIDVLEAENEQITDEHCQDLYQRFLSEGPETETVKEAGDKIQETIKDVTGVVSKVKNTTSEYNVALSDATGKLSHGMDKDQLESVLGQVMSNTQNMINQNQALAEELTQSAQTMEELQRDLDQVRKEALTDGLTLLANRKAFDTEIIRIAQESDDEEKIFALIMLDIDHFKSFNDNFGHQVGDQVLRLVAKTLIDGVKGRDIAARYGGEEFAIILPETNLQGGVKVADSLRRAVANKDVINRASGEKLGRITLSGGVAQYINGEAIEDLIGRADAGLYTAKHNGRNQVVSSPTPGQKKAAE